MKKRVYGISIIKATMANWNADFTGMPKSTSDGTIFGSDKAFKYPIKKMWENEGEKVLYIKSFKTGKEDKLQPRDLSERYELIFAPDKLAKKESSGKVLKNLFSAIDVMNFGATFAEKDQNISITGVVQVGQGFNKYNETVVESQDILSPFRNATKEEADASSLGTKTVVDEAHYIYPFSVNPYNLNDYIDLVDGFKGYTFEAYEKFKRACRIAATSLNTNSKSGCENELSLFIECKEGSKAYLPHLDRYITLSKQEKTVYVNLASLWSYLEDLSSEIEKVEIYINPHIVQLKERVSKLLKVETRHIYTGESI